MEGKLIENSIDYIYRVQILPSIFMVDRKLFIKQEGSYGSFARRELWQFCKKGVMTVLRLTVYIGLGIH